ncbi:hypothetical protein, partial [Alishewanella aestuarii]|uniref:hypothetical protein n=1 Tax=Alishewanella aestuarii TaxID=453835 RepID=UPI00058766F6
VDKMSLKLLLNFRPTGCKSANKAIKKKFAAVLPTRFIATLTTAFRSFSPVDLGCLAAKCHFRSLVFGSLDGSFLGKAGFGW